MPQLSVAVGNVHVTTAVHSPSSTSVVILLITEITGACNSLTVTRNEVLALFVPSLNVQTILLIPGRSCSPAIVELPPLVVAPVTAQVEEVTPQLSAADASNSVPETV